MTLQEMENYNEMKSSVQSQLADILRREIQDRGITGIGLANELGLSKNTITNICKGYFLPRLDTIEPILEHLGYRIEIKKSSA